MLNAASIVLAVAYTEVFESRLERRWNRVLLLHVLLTSVWTFALFVDDKLRAKWNKWRHAEESLLWSVVLGGAFGGLIGMLLCAHKSRKIRFWFLVLPSCFLYGGLLMNDIFSKMV